jgi:hypothetical protein
MALAILKILEIYTNHYGIKKHEAIKAKLYKIPNELFAEFNPINTLRLSAPALPFLPTGRFA